MTNSNSVAEALEQAAQATNDLAQAAAESSEPGALHDFLHSGALGMMLEGGVFMWPILFLGILGLGVIIERWRSLKMLNVDVRGLKQRVLDLLAEDKGEAAMDYAESQRGPVAAILSTGLRKYVVLRKLGYDPARIQHQVTQSMENYSVHIVAALERHLPVLATIASVAPMLGFLGTLAGMIEAFAEIEAKSGTANIVELAAAGIKVALLTTCFGLIIGIPAFMAFNYFTSVINRFVLEVEESATDLMEVVTLQVTLDGAGDHRRNDE